MKKQVLIPLLISLFAVTAWADVSVTERFSQVGEILNSNVSKTEIRTVNGDLCQWEYKGNRRDTTTSGFSDKLASGKLAWWTSGNNSDNLLRTKDAFEGGVKHIDLEWKQSTTADGATVIVDVIVGSTTFHPINYVGGNASTTVATTDQNASIDCNIKGNSQISITNLSTTTNKAGRILIGDITITPYLLYTQKKAFIGLSKTGYVNTNLIDNTDEEGNITYSIHDKDAETQNVAEINSSTGEITPLAVGKAVVTATWSAGATTSYELIVANTLVETFSSVSQPKSSGTAGANWTGSVCNWTNKYARRGTNDQINSKQASWLTLDENTRGFLRTTNLEGGLLGVTFDYAQFGVESGKVLKWQVSDGTNVYIVERDGDLGANKNSPDFCSCIFENHQNAQLEILNASVMDDGTQPTSDARLLIHNIAIAPYLLYTTKTHELYVGASYTNSGLINNTESGTITYSLEDNDSEATIDAYTGEVTALKTGEVTVKATWSEGAFTTYHLTIKSITEASFAENVKRVGLDALAISNPLNYTDGYDGTIAYSSSNTAVATVTSDGTVSLAGGVGQTTITATLSQTDNYKATSASYILYVRNNNGARVERFQNVTQPSVVGTTLTDWTGDLFTWQAQYQVRRGTNDTIHAGISKHQGTSIGIQDPSGTPKSSILQSKDVIEGGIKYLSFYWMQWGAASNCTRRIVVYADGTKIGEQEHPNGTAGRSGDEFLLGINNAMKSNKQLIIKNESYKGTVENLADNNCRIVMDNIYITPWLLYTDKSNKMMRIGDDPYTRQIINNTEGETGSLTYSSSNTSVATVNGSGQVTAVARGEATITAKFKWNETDSVTTSYKVEVFPVNCETFSTNRTAHTYHTAEYGNSYMSPESVVEDKCTWFAWLGGVVPSNYEPNVAVIRAPHTNEQGPAYLRSDLLTGGIGAMTFDWNLVADETNIDWDIRVLINGREVKRLGNDALSMTVLPEFGQITIDNINEPGKFVITFMNHSTVTSGTYTSGNKARFVIDNIVWTDYTGTKTLSEDDADNSGWIRSNIGQTHTVKIERSDLLGGYWNTLCLPFAISKAGDLGGAEVQQMTNASINGDELTIEFIEFTNDELTAGIPYLVKPTADVDISDTYENKTIASIASPVVSNGVTLQGIFSPTALVKDDYSTLFVGTPDGSGNNLYYPSENGTLKGFRAYFKIADEVAPSAPLRRARFVVNEQQVVTSIDTDRQTANSQKLLRNGQLIIIRDGVQYDVLGRKL